MSTGLELRDLGHAPATGPSWDGFIELPLRLKHAGVRPASRASTEWLLSAANPALRHGWLHGFVALRGGRPVARCAAMVNERLRHEGQPVGLVGFFDAAEGEPEAALAVLGAAVASLRERGLVRIWGPMNFSIFHSYRFLTEGFESTPFHGEPRNPPSHPQVFERFGFRPLMHWRGWDIEVDRLLQTFERERMVARMAQRGWKLAEPSLQAFETLLRAFHVAMVDGFRDNLGFSEIGFDEFAALYAPLRHVVRPELMPLVLGPDGSIAACSLIFPDPEEPERVVLHTIAVSPHARDRGLVQGFSAHCAAQIGRLGFRHAVAAMVKPGFSIFDRCGEPSRRYTLFELAR